MGMTADCTSAPANSLATRVLHVKGKQRRKHGDDCLIQYPRSDHGLKPRNTQRKNLSYPALDTSFKIYDILAQLSWATRNGRFCSIAWDALIRVHERRRNLRL